uniref:ribonucleoside-diphosphate reductase n=1 Tax=Trichoplusia ni single nucleopolyhedrovirus TaxID=332054 RepID=A0A481V8R0_9ABAC|nr:rr2 [Trichoplusia ni single nucleopolyhedrovirus]
MSSVSRKTLFPIVNEDLWQSYKKALDCHWKVEEIDMSKDFDDWNNKLNDKERFFLKHVLAFFAAADVIVNTNIIEHMQSAVPEMEASFFYAQQTSIECVHTEMYNILVVEYIKDPQECDRILNAIEHIDSVKRKATWAQKWIESQTATFAERMVAFAIVEGVFFSGSFAAIYYIKDTKKGALPGLTYSNELISRDEGLHTDFACLYYNKYIAKKDKLSESKVLNMFKEAVDIEKDFFTNALPVAMLGMNAHSMCEYIEFVADRLLIELGYEKYFKTLNPFEFMNNISLEGKTNFFEKRVGEYKRFGAANETYEILEDF